MPDSGQPAFAAAVDLPGLPYPALRARLLRQAADLDLPVIADDGASLVCRTPFGDIGALQRGGGGVRLTVSARDETGLFLLKERIAQQLGEALPEAAATMRWSDAGAEGTPPPNFRLAQVVAVEPIGQRFLRLTLAAERLDAFAAGPIHFRLVLPPPGVAEVEWPTLGGNGQTVWPSGEKALHRPVYTVRALDPVAGRLVCDVFIHAGGRVTDWLRGDPFAGPIGLVGPGGGGLLSAGRVQMFGDETAFPAIARILEHLPQGATGDVFLEMAMPVDADYPFAAPPGVTLHRLARRADGSLADLALHRMAGEPEAFLWFAAEKAAVQRVRAGLAPALKAAGRDCYISAFWTAAAD